jgi:hypothetical protein
MHCPFCKFLLIPDSFTTWNIGGRRMVAHYCLSQTCRMDVPLSDKIEVDLILPDRKVAAYTFIFTINDKWYRIYSHSGEPSMQITASKTLFFGYGDKPKAFTSGYSEKEVVITMDRFIPLDWEKPIEDQVEAVRDKLNILLPFI